MAAGTGVGRCDATVFRVGELFTRFPRVGPSPLCRSTGRPWAGLHNPFRIGQGVRRLLVRPALRGALPGKGIGTRQSTLPVVVCCFRRTLHIVLSGGFLALRASECNRWPRRWASGQRRDWDQEESTVDWAVEFRQRVGGRCCARGRGAPRWCWEDAAGRLAGETNDTGETKYCILLYFD